LTKIQRDNDKPKILLYEWTVKGKIAFKNSFGSQTQNDDLPLKCGAEKENPKNDITGSTPHLQGGNLSTAERNALPRYGSELSCDRG
jgi:hypothetical protein